MWDKWPIWLAIILAFVMWAIANHFVWPIRGRWKRIDAGQDEEWDIQQWALWVRGSRSIPGGYQLLYGWGIGPWYVLSRRDFGVQSLVARGFPATIAPLIEGQMTLRLRLKLHHGHNIQDRLEGFAVPHKFAFTHQPPRITGVEALAMESRSYESINV